MRDTLNMRSRPLRDTNPEKLHLLSCRTLRSELLFVPKAELNEIIGGVFARYQSLYRIEIFAIIVLSNHYHLLARAPEGNIPRFFESVNREIAQRVNRYLGRQGFVWSRRYDDLIVLEEEDALEALLYIVTNNVKHALGSHSRNWPGINSYSQSLGAKNKTYRFCNYTKYYAELVRKSDFEIEYTLEISSLGSFPKLKKIIETKLPKLIEERIQKLVAEHKREGRVVMSRKAILTQPLQGKYPKETNKTRRPICYTRSPEALASYAQERRLISAGYTDASCRFRQEDYSVAFPLHTIKPPAHHHPKLLHPQ